MPKHSPHHGLPVPPTPLWWEQRWVAISCKLYLLFFRAEMVLGACWRSGATPWGRNWFQGICKGKLWLAAQGSMAISGPVCPWALVPCSHGDLGTAGAGWESCPVLGWLKWEAGGILLPSFGIYTVTEEPSPVPFSLNGSKHPRVLHSHLCPFPTTLQERIGITVRCFHSCGVSSWASPKQDKAWNMKKPKKSTLLLLPWHGQELIRP